MAKSLQYHNANSWQMFAGNMPENARLYISRLILLLVILISYVPNRSYAQSAWPKDQWIEVMDGLSNCAIIGNSAGLADYKIDVFDVSRPMLVANGEVYAYLTYKQINVSNVNANGGACGAGFFKYDTVANKWMRVSTAMPNALGGGYGTSYLTNGKKIFSMSSGNVYELTTDYTTYPTGWKMLSKTPHNPVKLSDIWPAGFTPVSSGMYGASTAQAVNLSTVSGNTVWYDAIGDTIYVYHKVYKAGVKDAVMKFNIKTGNWTTQFLPLLPTALTGYAHPENIVFADAISGKYRYFYGTYDYNPSTCTPGYVYVYDPDCDVWKNISDGINWRNRLGGGVDNCPVAGGNYTGVTTSQCLNLSGSPGTARTMTVPSGLSFKVGEIIGFYRNSSYSTGNEWTTGTITATTATTITFTRLNSHAAASDCGTWYFRLEPGTGTWGPNNQLAISQDHKMIYVSSQQGIWKWFQSSWYPVKQEIADIAIYPNVSTLMYTSTGNLVTLADRTTFMSLGQGLPGFCYAAYYTMTSPDDGRTVYAVVNGNKGTDCGNGNIPTGTFLLRLKVDPDKPAATRNLHLKTATYLGGAGSSDNNAVGVGVGGKYGVFAALNTNAVGQFPAGYPYTTTNLFGATAASRGKIIGHKKFGDTIVSVTNVGARIDKYAMQNWGRFDQAICGDFGVAVLDSNGTTARWRVADGVNLPGTAGNPFTSIDIDDNGNVVVLRENQVRVFNNAGTAISNIFDYSSASNYGTDKVVRSVAIRGDTVFFGGESNGFVNHDVVCGCPDCYAGQAVRVPFLRAVRYVSGTMSTANQVWVTWGFGGSYMDGDEADAAIVHVNIGRDNKMHVAGLVGGGNSVFRWDGKTSLEGKWATFAGLTMVSNNCQTPKSTLVRYDLYNDLTASNAASQSYVGTIRSATGVVERGVQTYPLALTGGVYKAQDINIFDGYVYSDEKGFVYLGQMSKNNMDSRDMFNVSGSLVGYFPYKRDMSVLMFQPDFTQRVMWSNFSDTSGTGSICGVGNRGNVVAVVGRAWTGKMFTGTSKYNVALAKDEWKAGVCANPNPFNPEYNATNTNTNTNDDAYLAVWLQDVWSQGRQDSVENRLYACPSCPKGITKIMDFSASKTIVCVGEPFTILNKSWPIDSINNISWNFDSDNAGTYSASVPVGTLSNGPLVVSYNTPGYKSIKMFGTVLKVPKNCPAGTYSDIPTQTYKPYYINVKGTNVATSAIRGPATACSGATVYFEVDTVSGVSFEWIVPSGSTITNGDGSNKIQVVIAGSGSQLIQVRTKGPCGYGPYASFPITVTGPNAAGALLVVGNTTLNAGDAAIKTKLESKGYLVTVMKDQNSNPGDAGCVSLIVISYTVNSNYVTTKFRTTGVPVLIMKDSLYNDMGMTLGTPGTDFGATTASVTAMDVLNNAHELGKGVSGTPIFSTSVTSSNRSQIWAYSTVQATRIATLTGNANRATIFGYDVNAQMWQMKAPARRVGFFMDNLSASVLTTNGGVYFDNAICWLSNQTATGCSVPTSTISQSGLTDPAGAAKTTACPGDSVYVPFTTTGTFLSSNGGTFPAQTLTYNFAVNEYCSGTMYYVTNGAAINGGWTAVGTCGSRDYYTVVPNSGSGRTAASDPLILYAGNYTVSLTIPDGVATATAVPYTIQYSGGSVSGTLNMTTGGTVSGGNRTFNLGTYYCEPGVLARLTIDGTNATPGASTVAVKSVTWSCPTPDPLGGNLFVAQLSNNAGTFVSPVVIGTLKSLSGPDKVKALLPTNLVAGSYKIRVISTNPSAVASNIQNITIGDNPATPGPITPSTTLICKGQSASFSISAVPTATSYKWEVPAGAVIVGAPNNSPTVLNTASTSITVNFGLFGSTTAEIWVTAYNSCGASNAKSKLTVNITDNVPAVPTPIGGLTTVCQGMNSVTYAIPDVTNAISYQWSLPTPNGAVLVGSTTGTSVNVNFNGATNLSTVVLAVKAIGACGNSANNTLNIAVNNAALTPTLGAITATAGTCQGTYVYTVSPVQNASSYNWTVPTGGSITGGANTNQITVTYTTTGALGNVSLNVTTPCGTTGTQTSPVTVPVAGNQVLLVTTDGDLATAGWQLGTSDNAIKTKLTTLGFTTVIGTSAYVLPATAGCFKAIIISPNFNADTMNGLNAQYREASIPTMVMPNIGMANLSAGNNSACYTLRLTDVHYYASGSWYAQSFGQSSGATGTTINLVTVNHTISNSLKTTGNKVVYSSSGNLAYGYPYSTATIIARYMENTTTTGSLARKSGRSDNPPIIYAYESGAQMFNLNSTTPFYAPARRVGFMYGISAAQKSNPKGDTLFNNAMCWLTGVCPFTPLANEEITLDGQFVNEHSVKLAWTMPRILNSGYFTIERSEDGAEYVNVGTVTSGTQARGWGYLDETASQSEYYYRIKLITADNKTVYSNVKKVTREKAFSVELMPNPSEDNYPVTVVSTSAIRSVQVYDVRGQKMREVKSEGVSTELKLHVDAFAAGVYQVKVITEDGTKVERLVVR